MADNEQVIRIVIEGGTKPPFEHRHPFLTFVLGLMGVLIGASVVWVLFKTMFLSP